MNSVKCKHFCVRILKVYLVTPIFLILLLFSIYLVGCSDQVTLPSVWQLNEFENAGPVGLSVDVDRLVKAKIGGGPYRIIQGEVLELTMPAILQAVTKNEYIEGEKYVPYMCRVSDSGTIALPLVGELKVTGMTLAQIETVIIDMYYPKYAVTRPSVFAQVIEYNTAEVSISGAVNQPGIYSLRNDQRSLVALLMEAGGIVDEGAAVIRIIHRNTSQNNLVESAVEVTKNIPRHDIKENREKVFKPALYYTPSNQIEVHIVFEQSTSSDTTGKLTALSDDKVLLADKLDISSEIERSVFLKRLVDREPRISTAEVERKLCALVKKLEPGHGIYDSKYKTADINIYSNVEFNTSYPRQNLNTDTAISKELSEIASLLNDRKDQGSYISDNSPQEPEIIVLPVKGLNIPFADIVLHDGDSVIVERLQLPLFSVLGLVNKPGNFQYPPDVKYSLMQALAFAGGLDPTTEPRYATIYRLKPDGTIVHAIFQVANVKDRTKLTEAMNTLIKPGDIIAVEHTPRTRTKLFLDRVFRINIGTYLRLEDAWDD